MLKLVKLVGSRLRNILSDSTSGHPQPLSEQPQLPSFLCRNADFNVVVCMSKPDLNVGSFRPGFSNLNTNDFGKNVRFLAKSTGVELLRVSKQFFVDLLRP